MSEYKLYIVLTYSGTVLGRIIKYYTNAEFSHVSIALDENLEKMYSFSRINPYIFFLGGFVHEDLNSGSFKRFKNTHAAIYRLNVTKEQYMKVQEVIYNMYKNKEKYKFNIIGLFANGFNIKYERKDSFYCAEFIKYLFDLSGIDINLPELVKPNDFKDVKELKLKYKGKLNRYSKDK